MPGVGRYSCKSCHYVASNRRMLARHSVLIHLEKAFRCPLCPFVTKYAANWYRHKRDLHGLTKLTTCETCGFLASNTPELAQHKEEEHPELLQLDKFEDKYAKEKIRLTEGCESRPQETFGRREIKNEPDLLLDIYDIDQEIDIHIPPEPDDVDYEKDKYTPQFNGNLNILSEVGCGSISKEGTSDSSVGHEMASTPENLRPLRIRRSYNCDQCGLLTNNPREYLYHLRSVHGEKIAVHECKYCIYASKHIQKLQRHCNLVHRQQLEKDAEFKRHLEISKDRKVKQELDNMGMTSPHPSVNENFKNSGLSNKLPVKSKPQVSFFKCGICTYQTRNKTLMFHHEKTAHLKKKNFRCTECNYITSEKSRFTKHIKYHNLPKLQCNFCFFKTAYKWNMDRHMKNHEAGAEGNFRCSECNFTTSTKQSYNAHVTNHHDPSAMQDDQDIAEANGGNDSNEWEDMNDDDDDDEEEEGDNFENNNGTYDDYEFSESSENPDPVWKANKSYQRTLKCQQCDFRAAWPFELKKHEENHRSQKKHLCPMCGMRFEHIAWLIKHLRRIHGENPQAKSLANTFDVMKPARRRPGKEYAIDSVLPAFQDVLKQNSEMHNSNSNNFGKNLDSNKSMLSTLLKKPLSPFAPPSVSKYSTNIKSKSFNASSTMFKQPRISNYYQKVSTQEVPETKSKSTVPTCNICNYKTRWISELQRHMRVHSQEKPFQCHKCKYVCKWKGDLNRHLLKYHGIKMQPCKRNDSPKFGMKKSNSNDSIGDWQSTGQEKRNFSSVRSSQESPLDLTLGRETFPHPNAISPYDAYDFDSQSAMDEDPDSIDVVGLNSSSPMPYHEYKASIPQPEEQYDSNSVNSALKMNNMKYQCPRCPFNTTTVSKFHDHLVQHKNKRPFMCSVCGFNSNWEFDITKHIRSKGCRDKDHNKACVLLTDESGRRNYEKYEKYLVESNRTTPEYETASPEIHEAQENQTAARYNNTPKPNYNESSNKSCSYDFRNIGSNFEDGPVNIVVTPDIPLPDNPDSQDEPGNYMDNEAQNVENGSTNSSGTLNSNEAKFFYCKHCDFKHSTKRVVVSHLSSHAGLKPYRCRACGIVSNWRHVIVRHVKDVHNGFMNVVEERINYVQEGFALRLISVSNDNDNNDNNDNNEETIPDPEKSTDQFYGCKICPYKCDKEFYMNFHMKQHRPREGAVFKCDYCPYFVKFKKTLVRHMKLHNSPAASKVNTNTVVDIIDDQPQQMSNDIYMFNDNPENDQSNDQSIDDSIAISFTQLNQLDPSEASPQKIKRHICEHCPYKTDNKTQYLYHKQFHRPNPSAPFKCNICSYWATMQHLLTQHMRVHSESGEAEQSDSPKNSGPKQFFEFFDDNKGVPEKISIVYVKKGEESVKMFKCEFCPMMNKKKANVRVHQKMHGVVINDGRYACSYCNYQCLNQGGLTNHMKVHQKNLDQELFNRYGLDQSSRRLFDSLEEESPVVRKRTSSYFCFQCPGIFKTAGDLENHQKFHGCSLPLKCTYCDYRAKHKPHITQHLAVHTAEYKAKRKAATPMNASPTNKLPLEETYEENKEVLQPKKIDQMLLLEASDLKAALKKTGDAAANLHKCIFCPASFFKTTILVYHVSLHGSEGEYKCSVCDYAVSREDNLHIHSLVHPKKSPVKRNIKSYPCPKCPTVFYKQDRFERHQELHGKNYRFACDQCDYSVRFAANLIKHKKNHIQKDGELLDSSANNENTYQTSPSQTPVEYVLVPEVEEKRITYICDRCPYYQMRKDAVQSHQRRHWLKDGYECPYCDYSSMQNSFLQSHIKLHMQPSNLFPPQAFMKFESFKIFIKDDTGEKLLFDDESMVRTAAEKESDEINETAKIRDNKEDTQEIKSEFNEMIENSAADTNQSATADTSELLAADTNQSKPEREDMQKLFNYIQDDSHTDSNLSGSSSRSNKVPIVVLNDIFRNDKDLKKWDSKLKIPKLKISTKYARSSSSERSSKKLKTSDSLQNSESSKSKKSSKPSLVVKIKVENRISKNEKTMYSVSKSSDDRLSKDKENSLESAENTNDSTSDMIFQDSNPSLPAAVSISPVEDIEENTLTSNPDIEDRLRSADTSVTDMVDSIVGSTSDELILSRPSDENIDLKSDDSFSNDTVPAVSDILCDKLDCLTELSFKDSDLSLTNGDCSSHLTSTGLNLLPEEIKVGL